MAGLDIPKTSSVPKIEEIVLEKGTVGLGFNIRGGTDNIHIGSDPGIFVTTVKPNGAAAKDGTLQPGDKILEVNGNDLREVNHQKAVGHFHDAGEVVRLLVERGAEQRIRVAIEQLAAQTTSLVETEEEPQFTGAGSTSITSPLTIDDLSYPVPPRAPGAVNRSWGWLHLTLLGLGVGVGVITIFWYLRNRSLLRR